MPIIKDENDKTRNFIFQKDSKTIFTTTFIIIVLIILVIGVVISGFYFEWF